MDLMESVAASLVAPSDGIIGPGCDLNDRHGLSIVGYLGGGGV